MPVPKNWRQVRLTKTRAVSGFDGRHQPVGQIEARGALAAGIELAEEGGDGGLDDVRRFRPSSCRAARMRVSAGVGGFRHHHARDRALRAGRLRVPAWPPRCASRLHARARPTGKVRLDGRLLLRRALVFRRCAAPRSTASGISLPLSAAGQEYSPEESARRKRPMVARRYSESWWMRTVMTEPAWVRTGSRKSQRQNALADSRCRSPRPSRSSGRHRRRRRADTRARGC